MEQYLLICLREYLISWRIYLTSCWIVYIRLVVEGVGRRRAMPKSLCQSEGVNGGVGRGGDEGIRYISKSEMLALLRCFSCNDGCELQTQLLYLAKIRKRKTPKSEFESESQP